MSDIKSECGVLLKLPEFGDLDPRLWFAQAEAVFHKHRVYNQDSRYFDVVGNLPSRVASEVPDLIFNKPPENAYDILKQEVINRMAASDEQNLRTLLSGEELGDRTPSQHLRRLRQLQGERYTNDQILRELWLQSLPQDIVRVVAVVEQDTSLEKLAVIADQVYDRTRQFAVSNVHAPFRPLNALEK